MRVRNALLSYFALAFGISWTGALVAASRGRLYLLFVAMLLGPSVASIGLTAALEGTHGLHELGRALRRWRVSARWYAALLVAPALLAIVLGVLSRRSSSFLPDLAAGASPTAVLPYALIAGFGAGIAEELGWTGFATPRLLHRYAWFQAGLLLGLPWAAWHVLPDYLGRATHGPLWYRACLSRARANSRRVHDCDRRPRSSLDGGAPHARNQAPRGGEC
jgi:membrane protease YdiL (CAAX protease family)